MGDLIKLKPKKDKSKSKDKSVSKDKLFSKTQKNTRGLMGTALGLVGIGAALELLD